MSNVPTTYTIIGKAIRELRETHGWTLHVLAVRCGLDKSELAKIERGQRMLRVETVELIAREFGMAGWELQRFAQRLDETIASRHEDTPQLTHNLWRAA